MQQVVIVDYGMGNLFSVQKKLDQMNVKTIVSSSISDIESADKIILPGVGHFEKALINLEQMKLTEVLNHKILEQKTPVLGICLGMQLMCNQSEEGEGEGLKWIDATVKRFQLSNTLRYKVPHTGWNEIEIVKESPLMSGITNGSEFYFVHRYYVECNNPSDVLNTTNYEINFSSAFQKDNIFGVQYHPEKSHDTGTKLITNFVNL
jgi:glutamine amidotransferase